jgi:hypothetical protein
MVQIRDRSTGELLFQVDAVSLAGANLRGPT